MSAVPGDSPIFSGLDIDLEPDAVRNAFFQRYLADRENGVARGPAGYQALFPGWEALVAAEHRALEPTSHSVLEAHQTPKAGVSSHPAEAAIPARVGRYEVRGILGKGGMGIVYLASDPTLSRTVVLKTLRSGPRAPARIEALARLMREARIAGRLDVEGICPVLDVVEADRLFYVLMPFIPGKTLAQVLDGSHDPSGDWCVTPGEHDRKKHEDAVRGELRVDSPGAVARLRRRDFRRMLLLMQRIAQVLHQAHEAGVVHRDLKPGNIMVRPDGTPVILDFGLAVEGSDEGPLQLTEGDVFGTPRYMAPEQIEGRIADIDRRTDVHALGVMLYEMIALRRPFEGPSTEAVHRLILEGKPRSLRAVVPGVSKDLDAVCAKAMARDREDRYATAEEFARDVGAVIEGRPTIARPPSWRERIAYLLRSHPVAASLLLACLLGTTALVVWSQRDRAGRSVDYLQAYDRYRDAFDHFQQADFDQTGLAASDVDLLLSPFRDTTNCGSLLRDPFSRETYIQIKKHAQSLPRGQPDQAGLEFRLQSPRGVVTTGRPTFRFERTRAPERDSSLFLRLEEESQPVQRIALPAGARSPGPVTFTLPGETSLITGSKYAWSLVEVRPATDSAPSTERLVSGRFDLVVASPRERDALLRSCPRTGRESLDILTRAGVLIAHNYLDLGLAELDRLSRDVSPADRACALMLRAGAAYHLGDEDVFYKCRDEALALKGAQGRR